MMQELHAEQVAMGERFKFGENWQRFLSTLDEDRLATARRSFQQMLGLDSLTGLTMLDVGCGSGLFSLAAVQLGAERVHSFDFDPASVACAIELKRRHPFIANWTIEQGSALDGEYIRSLGEFDLVYSWGVLHHTGDMLLAMGNLATTVRDNGRLFISIYNDQGRRSRRWRAIKRTYNLLPRWLQTPFAVAVMAPHEFSTALRATVRLHPQTYVQNWTRYKRTRGMSRWHDIIDWCGGYPFEVAKPEEIFEFYRTRGFALHKLKTCGGGLGCNEFVFSRAS